MGTGSGGKDAFGPGNGLSHEFGLAMDDEGVTPSMFKQAVSARNRKASVGAVLRGELLLPVIDVNDLIAREIELTTKWCGLAEIDYPGDKIVRQVMRDADKARKGLTVNDRFRPLIPAESGLEQTFQFFYGWNTQCDAERQPGLKVKLVVNPGDEFWRTDKKAERLVVECGVFRAVPLAELANPWDSDSRPYNLPYDKQDEVCREKGGEGLSTTEDLIWLAGRGTLENPGRPCWAPAWFRCKNTYDSGNSLGVCWGADGLKVDNNWNRDNANYNLGVVPRWSPPKLFLSKRSYPPAKHSSCFLQFFLQ